MAIGLAILVVLGNMIDFTSHVVVVVVFFF